MIDMADIQSPKVHKFTLKMKHKNKIQKMYMVSGDSNSDLLVISLEDSKDGSKFEPFILQESSIVTVVFLKEDGNVVTGQAEISGPNEIQYLIKGNEISFPGIVEAQVQVYGDDSRLSSWDFSFNVKESLDNDDVVESTTEYSGFAKLINEVSILKKEIVANIGKGNYVFQISNSGYLELYHSDDTTPPDITLNNEGHLILTIQGG